VIYETTTLTSFLLRLIRIVAITAATSFAADTGVQGSSPVACRTQSDAAIQILGSGGPMHGDGRGSAAYVFWYRGRAEILVDAGGGTSVALARVGVRPNELRTILISHLHPDHVADLPDLLWGEMVTGRKRDLDIVGPSAGEAFPDIKTFFDRQFGAGGAYPFMRSLLTGEDFRLRFRVVPVTEKRPEIVWRSDDLVVRSYPVPHGKAPSLAYRIDGPGFSAVLGGDQTGADPGFSIFTHGTTLLILHAIITNTAAGASIAKVVALPRNLGILATNAEAQQIVLSHLMKDEGGGVDARYWSLNDAASVLSTVAAATKARVSLAADLACYPLKTAKS
jgi:ribonuclease BN (tRNA processing enzyme)